MNNQQILDNAPEGATHYDSLATWKYKNLEKGTFYVDESGTSYRLTEFYPNESLRSLADIRRIVELENALTDAMTTIGQLQRGNK